MAAIVKYAAVCVLLAGSAATASAEIKFDTPSNTGVRQEIDALGLPPLPIASAALKAPKEWTVMVFINAKNDLEPFGMLDINEMEAVGSSNEVNVVAELGRMDGYDASDGDWKGVRRYLIGKDSEPGKITSPVLADLGHADMGDYKHLVDFAKWAMSAYPARKYMLIVWNHGSGWTKTRAVFGPKGISYDEETGNNITTPQLGLALKAIGPIALYASDACLMQMVEVVYELGASVGYVVGSEETEPNDGYAYDRLLGPLVANPAMSAEELGKLAVDSYADHYQAKNEGYTASLLRTSALPRLLALTDDFAAALMLAGEGARVKASISRAQRYTFADNRDMWHVADRVAADTKSPSVKAAAAAIKEHISKNVIVHNRAHPSYADSHGLAFYAPVYYYNVGYNKMAWAAASKWDELIGWYLQGEPW